MWRLCGGERLIEPAADVRGLSKVNCGSGDCLAEEDLEHRAAFVGRSIANSTAVSLNNRTNYGQTQTIPALFQRSGLSSSSEGFESGSGDIGGKARAFVGDTQDHLIPLHAKADFDKASMRVSTRIGDEREQGLP